MNSEAFNQLTIILGVLSLLLSMAAIIVSIVMSAKSNSKATIANEIAKKALDMSQFSFQGEILPNIKIKFYAGTKWMSDDEVSCDIFIENLSRGKATIERIETHLVQIKKEEVAKFPLAIFFNGTEILEVEIPAINHEWVRTQAKDLNISLQKSYIISFTAIAIGGHFKVYFTDVLGKKYSTLLTYDQKSKDFIGRPEELKESPK